MIIGDVVNAFGNAAIKEFTVQGRQVALSQSTVKAFYELDESSNRGNNYRPYNGHNKHQIYPLTAIAVDLLKEVNKMESKERVSLKILAVFLVAVAVAFFVASIFTVVSCATATTGSTFANLVLGLIFGFVVSLPGYAAFVKAYSIFQSTSAASKATQQIKIQSVLLKLGEFLTAQKMEQLTTSFERLHLNTEGEPIVAPSQETLAKLPLLEAAIRECTNITNACKAIGNHRLLS